MNAAAAIEVAGWFFAGWFVLVNGGYLLLNLVAFVQVPRRLGALVLDETRRHFWSAAPPVSIVVPAFDEAPTIVGAVRSLLQLEYAQTEVIVVNDGSTDATLAVLRQAFDLVPSDEAPPHDGTVLATCPVRGTYGSRVHPSLRVIDKGNGGKADALNAGLNAARHPLVCAVDADSVLARDGLARLVSPFLDDPDTIAAGGTVRLANGCSVRDGHLEHVGLPRGWLARIQVVEYLRAFLFGRIGWSPLNAVLIISGAFGVFRSEAVRRAGGWSTATVGEDMDLVLRLHRMARAAGRRYRIVCVPDPVLWTEAPESLAALRRQRMRWHRGLGECLRINRALCTGGRGGAAGWLAYPFFVLAEWLSPLVETAACLLLAVAFAAGLVDVRTAAAFLLLAIGTGLLLSVSALLLEELHFRVHAGRGDLARLLAAAVLENLGYRQLLAAWRCAALLAPLAGRPGRWGRSRRSGAWQRS